VGQDIIKKLIQDSKESEGKITFILSSISENLTTLQKNEKKETLKLLPIICKALDDLPFLSRILTIIQSVISDENSSLYNLIASIFGEIVEIINDNRTQYELLQGFCIYNMKQEIKANQICGSLCLTSLIESCPLVLEPSYMKYIWENVIYFIEKPNYLAKCELLNSVISLIFASESLFKPFATITLFKVLDYLTDSDWLKRKLGLNIVYTLSIYCEEEIIELKEQIIQFLKVLKSDKVKDVRDVCQQTLKLFNEFEGDSNNGQNGRKFKKFNSMQNNLENKPKKSEKDLIVINKPKISNKTVSSIRSVTPKRIINRDTSSGKIVDSKMVIKDNPKRSIFKSKVNENFFKQNNDGFNIVIKAKENIQAYQQMSQLDDEEAKVEDKAENENFEENSVEDQNLNKNPEKFEQNESNEKEEIQDVILTIQNEPIIHKNEIFESTFKPKTTDEIPFRKIEPKEQQHPDITELLKQMKLMSDKQLLLIDSIDKIQNNTQGQLEVMNNKINKLETTVTSLVDYIQTFKKDFKLEQLDQNSPENILKVTRIDNFR
jgi:hypothetical protein